MVNAGRRCAAARAFITIAKWAIIVRSPTAAPACTQFAVGLPWAIAVGITIHFSTHTGPDITNMGRIAFGLTGAGLFTRGVTTWVDVRKTSVSILAALVGARIPE